VREPQRHLRLRPVASRRLSDAIAEQLTRAIRSAGLAPGARLPTEHELARQLGVGRTTVREGLQKLQAVGLIEVRKGSGAYVADPRASDPVAAFASWSRAGGAAAETFAEVRLGLETYAAALAALRAQDAAVEELRLLHEAHAGADPDDLAVLVATDEAFHEAVLEASGNDALARVYALLIVELTDFRRRTLALPWSHRRSAAGHAAVVEAITEHDPQRARRAMLDHLWPLYEEIHAAGESSDIVPLPRSLLE
jgi:GntR family transcriptional repressor for pyruvate dehydrogenase complex